MSPLLIRRVAPAANDSKALPLRSSGGLLGRSMLRIPKHRRSASAVPSYWSTSRHEEQRRAIRVIEGS